MDDVHRITKLLRKWSHGDGQALEELFPLVYDELHRLAFIYLRRERPGFAAGFRIKSGKDTTIQ